MNLSEEHTAFYYEIGVAITQWAHVERAVLEVIGTCVAQSEFNALGHGFFSIENFRSKVAFADSLLKNTLSDSGHLQDWGGLLIRLTNASKIRNKIAHYCVMGYPAHNEAGRRYCLQPRIQEASSPGPKTPRPLPGSLCVRDVVSARYTFFSLMVSLENYACRLRGQPEQFQKSSEEPMKAPTIKVLRDQLRGLLGGVPST